MKRRILKSIINQKERSLIILLVFVLIVFSLSFSFLFNNASSKLKDEFTTAVKPKVAIMSGNTVINSAVDYIVEKANNNLDKDEQNNSLSSYSDDIKLAIDYFNYDNLEDSIITTPVFYLVPYSEQNGVLILGDSSVHDEEKQFILNKINKIKNNQSTYWSYGYIQSIENNEEFDDVSLLEGSLFSDKELEDVEYKIILSSNYIFYDGATTKKVEIGDIVTYSLFKKESEKSEIVQTYDFEVIGIVDAESSNDRGYFVNYVPKECLKEIINECYPLVEDDLNYVDTYIGPIAFTPTIFTLSSLDDIDSFVEYFNYLNDSLDRNYTYETNVSKYIKLAGSIESMNSMFSTLYIFAIFLSIFTLYFVIMFDVSKRKREIGTLMSLGESKKNIAIEFCVEYLIYLMVSLVIVLLIETPIIKMISNTLISLDTTSTYGTQSEIFGNIELSNLFFDTSLSFINIIKILLIVLAVSIPSIIFSVLYISHFNPKEVLKDE